MEATWPVIFVGHLFHAQMFVSNVWKLFVDTFLCPCMYLAMHFPTSYFYLAVFHNVWGMTHEYEEESKEGSREEGNPK